MRIIREIHGTVLDAFVWFCLLVQTVKHAVFPTSSDLQIFASRALRSFELVSVMGVIEVKAEVFVSVHMNDNGCMVDNVKVKIFEIFESISELFDSGK